MSVTTGPATQQQEVVESGRARAARLVVVAVFALLSLFVLGLAAWHVVFDGFEWSGSFGYVFDSMQYLAWVREMGDHVLSANMFDLAEPMRDYINPGLALSGLLSAIGVPADLAYGIWVPIGIAALAFTVTRFVRTLTPGGWTAVAAIALALLYKLPAGDFVKPLVPKANWNATVYSGYDSWPPYWSWGYSLTAIAVSLLCAGLLLHERERSAGRAFAPLLATVALTTSWLQPWQGALLLAMIVGGELTARFLLPEGARPRPLLIVTTCIAGTLPLAYYAVMGVIDEAWRINGLQANRYLQGVSWWTPLLVLFPLLAAGSIAVVRDRPQRFIDIAIRLWPPLAIAEMLTIAATGVGNTAQHALKGVSIPLAILAVQGTAPYVRRLAPAARAAIAVVAVALLTVPGAWFQVKDQINEMTPTGRGGYFMAPSDTNALDWIASSKRKGGVVASSLIGSMVPWRTGRQTWVGHETWTPRFQSRSQFMEVLLGGALPYWNPPGNPAAVLRWTGAAFLIDDCYHHNLRRMNIAYNRKKSKKKLADLDRQLAPVTQSIHRFGCAAVYELKPESTKPAPPADVSTYRLVWTKRDD